MRPRYPIYVISKGRADCCLTAQFLQTDRTPFRIVVEPQEFNAYAAAFDRRLILELPFSNLGLGSIPARNWVWEHAKQAGFERHWILDDNIRNIVRMFRGHRIVCDSSLALAITEEFIDRYENVGIGGLNYEMFIKPGGNANAYARNIHVYSCLLIRNDLPYRWRGRYNEDTDLCLQVLSGGFCTVLMNLFLIAKVATMSMKGGNSAELYKGDGRLKMARSLERLWPGVVVTKRKFQRPQHYIKPSIWKCFDTPLKLKATVDAKALKDKTYPMKLVAVKPVRSERLRALLNEKIS